MTTTKALDAGLARTVYSAPIPIHTLDFDADPKFWARVEIGGPDECWKWTGPKNADGYGTCSHGSAHRHAWRMANGVEIPQGLYVLHACDCRDCVNPSHLHLGTQRENMLEKFARGRHTDFTRKLSRRDVIRMRRLAAAGHSYADLAEQFGVTHGHARNCLNGNKWGALVDDGQLELAI